MKKYITLSLALLIPWALHTASTPRKSTTVKKLEAKQQQESQPSTWQRIKKDIVIPPFPEEPSAKTSIWQGMKQDFDDFTKEVNQMFHTKKSPKKFISPEAFFDGGNQTPPALSQEPLIPSDPLAISMVTAYQASKESTAAPHVVITIDQTTTQESPTIVLPEMQTDSIEAPITTLNETAELPTQIEAIALHSLTDSIDTEPTLTEAEQYFIKQNARRKVYDSRTGIPETPYNGKKYTIESSDASESSKYPAISFTAKDLQTTRDHIRSINDKIRFSVEDQNKYIFSPTEKTSEPLFDEYQLLLQDDSNTSASTNTNAIDLREFAKNLTPEQKDILKEIHNYFFESEVSLRAKTTEQRSFLLTAIVIPETAKTPTLLEALKAYTQITRGLKNNCEEKIKILEKQFEIDTSTLFTTSGENKPTGKFLDDTKQYKNPNKENLLKKRKEVIEAFTNINRAQRTIKNHKQLAAIRDDLSAHLAKTQNTASWTKTLGLK